VEHLHLNQRLSKRAGSGVPTLYLNRGHHRMGYSESPKQRLSQRAGRISTLTSTGAITGWGRLQITKPDAISEGWKNLDPHLYRGHQRMG
jgi:hypothetical protein